MKKLFLNLTIFLSIGYLIGEIIVRIFHLSADIPKMYLGEDNLIKNSPNQTGFYLNGTHKWLINKYGNYGYEPKSLNNLITVIGDSYIENVMNPPECNQAKFLSELNTNYDFFPEARSGASFIEFMERSKSCFYLKPIKQLLFVHHGDFVESISEIKNNPLTVQISLKNGKINYPTLPQKKWKEIIYNLKFIYFIYRNYLVSNATSSTNNRNEKSAIDYNKIEKLLEFTLQNYKTENIILVFSPDSDKKLVLLCKEKGFKCIELKVNNYKTWQLATDTHWSCYGHLEAAKQVSSYLKTIMKN